MPYVFNSKLRSIIIVSLARPFTQSLWKGSGTLLVNLCDLSSPSPIACDLLTPQNHGVFNCRPRYWRPNLITFQADETSSGKVPDHFPAWQLGKGFG